MSDKKEHLFRSEDKIIIWNPERLGIVSAEVCIFDGYHLDPARKLRDKYAYASYLNKTPILKPIHVEDIYPYSAELLELITETQHHLNKLTEIRDRLLQLSKLAINKYINDEADKKE